MYDSGVVEEAIVIPVAAVEAMAEIAETVVDASVPADFRGPEAVVEDKGIIVPAPPSRGPEMP